MVIRRPRPLSEPAPEEERLPEGPAYRFEGLENDGRVDASPGEVRRLYEEGFAAHCAAVREMARLSKQFPPGLEYRVGTDTTLAVRASISWTLPGRKTTLR